MELARPEPEQQQEAAVLLASKEIRKVEEYKARTAAESGQLQEFPDKDVEQEAVLYYKLDKAKKRLSLSQSTNALAESGTDPETTEIRNLVENCGFVWALGKTHGKTDEIVTTRALINAYRLLGGAAFTHMLNLLWDIWQGDPCSLTAAVLSGMALLVKNV